nr:Retrovirus-related Pol polyprotein from transposon TNT 1-94 [Ipomoea batatas]
MAGRGGAGEADVRSGEARWRCVGEARWTCGGGGAAVEVRRPVAVRGWKSGRGCEGTQNSPTRAKGKKGYPNGHKGYRVYNPNDGTFSTTRDLSFIENIFPLKGSVHDLESRAERPHSRLEPMNDKHYDIQRIVQAQEANNGSTEHNQLEVENDCTTPIETSELVDIHATENHEPVEPPVPTHNMQQQHRSQRTRSMPKYLENYETTLPPSLGPTPSTHPSASSTVYPLSQYVSYDNFSC